MGDDGRSWTENSRVIVDRSHVRRVLANSRVVSTIAAVPDRTEDSYRNSRTATSSEAVREWYRSSRLSDTSKRLGCWIRSSFLYRWLTKEPEPEVIVIDLTETMTVGPIIRLLDRGIRGVESARPSSTVDGLVSETSRHVRRRPVQILSSILLGVIMVSGARMLAGGTTSTGSFLALGGIALLAALGLRVRDSWEELQNRRVVQFGKRVLEPPEPPDAKSDE